MLSDELFGFNGREVGGVGAFFVDEDGFLWVE